MQAGRMLASMAKAKLRYENCVVLALDDGGVIVGAQIAISLHCIISMIVSKDITLPREPKAIAGITAEGKMAYNHAYSQGEIDEYVGEYRTYIEEERLVQFHELNRLMGAGGSINPNILRHMNVILVSDGLKDTMKLDLAEEYLKPIEIDHLYVALPIASVEVIDRIHVMADGVFCLSVIDDYMETDHYYDKNDLPSHQKIVETLNNIVLHWK